MNSKDRSLGMNAEISRRDFLNGLSVALGASLLPGGVCADHHSGQYIPGYYPPGLTGMRGSHPGSFEVGHKTRDGISWDAEDIGEEYDLVVVGGGLSGLSAAYFYRQAMGNSTRILILDNHDDFGGHAKRNEFVIDERLMIGYGGTMFMEEPGNYPRTAKRLMRELGVDTDRYHSAYDRNLYESLGLSRGTFFDQETFGRDYLAVGDLSDPDVLAGVPLSARGREDLVRLLTGNPHLLDDIPPENRLDYLRTTDYRTYLSERGNIGQDALAVLQSRSKGTWAVGIDALPASVAWSSGYPGFAGLKPGDSDEDEAETERDIFHFPDGNASIARMLVRNLNPSVAPGDSMVDIVTAPFDYQRLDDPAADVRVRLNSTAVRVRHIGDDTGKPVQVSYVQNGKAGKVTGGKVVLACYHAIIPRLCPEMPQAQRAVLSNALRAPLVYTNVLIRNWTSFANLGLSRASCPGSYHTGVTLDFPVSLGEYQCPRSPDEPMILHLTRVPGQPGLSAPEQFAAGKRDLLATSFETFERNIREQLGRMLSDGGFDPARDIAGITVNRWPHGYAYAYDPGSGRVAFEPSQWPEKQRTWVRGRQRFGNISIAATDAASNAMTESAIEEAYRAVSDLTS